jgi:murein DD-endopeptidase MepM/ murein hydrolase activator NlpD
MALVVVVFVVTLATMALSGPTALADDPGTTTTTEPAPDTTTTTAPDTTTTAPTTDTTVPTTDTTSPAPDTTTTPPASTTTAPTGPAPEAGKLDPGEALDSRPEFAALTAHQRSLVQELQAATDTYALRRLALGDLARQVAAANDALEGARAAENRAIEHEFLGLTDALLSLSDDPAPVVSKLAGPERVRPARAAAHRPTRDAAVDDPVAAFDGLKRRLDADRKNARLARVQAQTSDADLSARLAAQTAAVADAAAARGAAEAALERELGPDAVRARPDGITATLATAQAGQPDPIVIGGIAQPIPGAALSSPFGLRNDPLGGGAGFHPGIDFSAGSGTPIHAAAAGVVVTAGDCGGYGNCVVIDHGVSLATVYGHQSQVLVGVGEQVVAGQVIGLVGSTGMSTGPHLHFEVRLHGLPIDPLLAFFTS